MSSDPETVDRTEADAHARERNRVAWNLPRALPAAGPLAHVPSSAIELGDTADEPTADG